MSELCRKGVLPAISLPQLRTYISHQIRVADPLMSTQYGKRAYKGAEIRDVKRAWCDDFVFKRRRGFADSNSLTFLPVDELKSPACFVPYSDRDCRPCPPELVERILLLADLSTEALLQTSHVCHYLQDVIDGAPALQKRLFLEYDSDHHGLNELVLSNKDSGLRFWCSTSELYHADSTRLMDMLLSRPPATKIRATLDVHRQRSRKRFDLQVQRVEGVRVGDVVAEMKRQHIPASMIDCPNVTILEPANLASYCTKPQMNASRRPTFDHLTPEELQRRLFEVTAEVGWLWEALAALTSSSRETRVSSGTAAL